MYQEIVAWASLIRTSHSNRVSDILWYKTGVQERLFAGSSCQIDTDAPEVLVQVFDRRRVEIRKVLFVVGHSRASLDPGFPVDSKELL